ncbi:hypothetical protein C8D88_114103 [Lentzea atacamensis]|uniref:Uncharacterized protein n=2 Tax=Lentzea TaxID=165301 RepID=A0A316HM05_9PSEU|nr:hypothetical protein [Lentzea atacamensis]PWK82235.1 hypothetical protein C8D88_114103 [Lentzea atacamensis]RAS64676.1 hypothetical protein C8D87_105166 [Lentzea atacamensis]
MDKTRLGIGLVIGVLVVQTLACLVWSPDATLTGIGLAFNAVAAVSAGLFVRRGGRAAWVVAGWCAGFFGWHVAGLGELAGWWTTGMDAAFLVASQYQVSVVYQAVMATAAGFAVHLLLPRR